MVRKPPACKLGIYRHILIRRDDLQRSCHKRFPNIPRRKELQIPICFPSSPSPSTFSLSEGEDAKHGGDVGDTQRLAMPNRYWTKRSDQEIFNVRRFPWTPRSPLIIDGKCNKNISVVSKMYYYCKLHWPLPWNRWSGVWWSWTRDVDDSI